MLKRTKLYIIGFVLFSLIGCKKTNWRENYQERSKEPFGTYIFANELETLFNYNEFTVLDEHIYDYLLINPVTTKDQANYVCIKSYAYQLDKKTTKKLLDFVAVGNDIFLSLNSFNDTLEKELNFKTENLDSTVYDIEFLKELDGTFYLNNQEFKVDKFYFDRNIRKNYFKSLDSTKTVVLGSQNVPSEGKKPNFIKISHGEGNVYLHTQPIVFTNYYLLKDTAPKYVENVFSYLPDRSVLLDTQTKRSKYNYRDEEKSALQFFYKHPTLKWALYVGFIGLLLFLFLNARRKQRAIPELKPLKNSTQDFTHTIANLYLREDNHKDLVNKKITYFLEKVRSKYHLDTQNLNSTFIEKLAAKSGNTEHTTKYLINTITTINKRSQCSQEELVQLNSLIENFIKNK